MSTTIRIRDSRAGVPKGGFIGALAGGTEDGQRREVEVETDETGIDALNTIVAAQNAFVAAFGRTVSEPVVVRVPDDMVEKVFVASPTPGGVVVMPDSARFINPEEN
jgi:hypothetical protein